MKSKAAAAFFVRTPGLSEPKSRLGERVGVECAREIYELSLDRCKELADELHAAGVEVIWAVAEKEGVNADFWAKTGYESVLSGKGDLGECLSNMYSLLKKRADTAFLLGSDSPQIMLGDVKAACDVVKKSSLVVGPATDGGFYLFGGKTEIPAHIWCSVEYSVPTTLNQLEVALGHPLQRLSMLTDFDDLESLHQVIREMPQELSSTQENFIALARSTLEEMRFSY